MTTTEEFETNHLDRVTCLHINHDGSKIVTGSVDHRIKVWSVSPRTQERTLIETFTAHDADIRDVKWLHPSTGTHLASVGNDLKFQLYTEDPTQAPNSGRRFRKLCHINSPTKVPFVSLDFCNIDRVYTYLALIDRQGLLSIYEPANPDEFKEWSLVDRWYVSVPVPGRGEQTSFKVRWDQNVMPLPYVCGVSNDRRQLSLVVTAGIEVKIYRGVASEDKSNQNENPGDGEASHRIIFYEAAKLPAHPALVRDVHWAPYNIRGTDLFATACRDGAVRIFEMSVTEHPDSSTQAPNPDPNASTNTTPNRNSHPPARQQTQSSNLTSAITGRQQSSSNVASPNNTATASYTAPRSYRFPYRHNITTVANLENAHDDAWSVSWDPNGQVLISGGADGSTKIWRRSVLDMTAVSSGGGSSARDGAVPSAGGGGKWLLFADQAVSLGEERSGSDEDE